MKDFLLPANLYDLGIIGEKQKDIIKNSLDQNCWNFVHAVKLTQNKLTQNK